MGREAFSQGLASDEEKPGVFKNAAHRVAVRRPFEIHTGVCSMKGDDGRYRIGAARLVQGEAQTLKHRQQVYPDVTKVDVEHSRFRAAQSVQNPARFSAVDRDWPS
jgi:hypothetical protein